MGHAFPFSQTEMCSLYCKAIYTAHDTYTMASKGRLRPRMVNTAWLGRDGYLKSALASLACFLVMSCHFLTSWRSEYHLQQQQ
jgi:hypothetical protein